MVIFMTIYYRGQLVDVVCPAESDVLQKGQKSSRQ